MTALSVIEAYRRWAPAYAAENALTTLEREAVDSLTPPVAGIRLLDAGCGTGRRLHGTAAAVAVGVDISDAMIAEAQKAGLQPKVNLAVGDIRALDISDGSFDLIWCRLVIGHLPDCNAAYRELARVADAGATIIVSDFHPAAYESGHRRTFRAAGEVHEVEHYVHQLDDHLAAADAAGLELVTKREATACEQVRHYYEEAGRAELYERHRSLPLVLVLVFRKRGRCGS